MIEVYAPATIGNVSVGFDVLGVAISPINGIMLGDRVFIEAANSFDLQNKGRFVNKLPIKIVENIVYQCWNYFCKEINKELKIKITLEKNMPVSSGLGSSACSIVASLIAINEFCNKPLNKNRLLLMMGELEGLISGSVHYDNVAPCFLGGMRLVIKESNIISQQVPCFNDWIWVVAYPGIALSTEEARTILPDQYSREDIITHSRLLAGFIHACHTNQPYLAVNLMKDIIAEPYRTKLIPGFTEACRVVKSIGAICCGISGSGPTLFAVCNNIEVAKKVSNWLNSFYVQNEEGFVHICCIDTIGARKLG